LKALQQAERGAQWQTSKTVVDMGERSLPKKGASAMLDKVSRKTIKCPECGLKVQRFYSKETGIGKSEIPASDYVKQCRLAPERAAFDFKCPKLQAAIDAVVRRERPNRQQHESRSLR
jgi:ssDNA-binding Zn-finger/Zn-ribbon topoisomerase 1